MRRLLFGVLMVPAIASAGFVAEQKSALTGKADYTYMINGTAGHAGYSIDLNCESSGKLFLKYCRPGLYSFSRRSCSGAFHYKFDNEPLAKFDGYSGFGGPDTTHRAFTKKMIVHDKVILATHPDIPSMPTPTFDVREVAQQVKKFKGQCGNLSGSESTPAAKAPTPQPSGSSNAHKHGGREHSHPLPAQGVAHKHGNSEVGRAK